MKKSFMTRMLAVSLSAAMTFSLSSASSLTATDAAAKKLPANNKAVSISLKVGKTKVLKLKNYKAWNIKNATSNKQAVAKATKQGTAAKRTIKVKAVKKGTAKVTLVLGKRKTADSKTVKYSKTIKKVVTVKVKAAAADTTPADTTPTDTTPTDTTPVTTPTDSAVNVTPGALNISQVAATKVDTLAVSFSSIVVSTGAVKITVTKGTDTTPIEGKVTWNAEANGATIVTTAKLTKGTYTVTATDGKETTTGTVEIEDQVVKEIVFKNTTALTGKDNDGNATMAYVYYDVLDQYGESMKDTTSIQWTASATVKQNDRAKGRLTIVKNTGSGANAKTEAFTYGDKIYVTGVYTKTGISASETFTVGTEQSADSIKFVGFVKKDRSDIVDKLPANFKLNEYQMLYTAYDQNGNEIDASDYVYGDSDGNNKGLTMISDNVLVVKEIVGNDGKTVTINGTEYCAANIKPGINVSAGGTVNVSAISTKTGKKTELNFVVGAYRTLKKFEIGVPSGVVADGESVVLPFKAEDADGNEMTNFKELATQSDFSKLTFNQSVGSLVLEERDDGSARLVWSDGGTEAAWGTSSTNGIDRPISLTAIVVGGETSNQMIYVSDRARPEAIADVDLAGVTVFDSEQKIDLSNFTFLDQYGRNMKNTYLKTRDDDIGNSYNVKGFTANSQQNRAWDDGGVNKGYLYDNEFFNYAGYTNNSGGTALSGTDFNGYYFAVGMETVTDADFRNVLSGTTETSHTYDNGKTRIDFDQNTRYGYKVSYAGEVNLEPTLKFTIEKCNTKKNNEWEDVSKTTTKTFKVVPFTQLSNFTAAGLGKFNIETTNSSNDTAYDLALGGNTTDSELSDYVSTDYIYVNNDADYNINASYNGTVIEIPASYYRIDEESILQPDSSPTDSTVNGDKKIKRVEPNSLQWRDLYDVTSARYTRKDASVTVKANVFTTASAVTIADILNGDTTKEKYKGVTVQTTALISDADPVVASIVANDTVTINPTKTTYELSRLMGVIPTDITNRTARAINTTRDYSLADAAENDLIEVKDQYGKNLYVVNAFEERIKDYDYRGAKDYMEFEYEVRDIQESSDGFVANNFTVNGNSTTKAEIVGAEPGDTFTLIITAKTNSNLDVGGSATKTVKVTVGGDTSNIIHESDNFYNDANTVTDTPASPKANNIYVQGNVRQVLQYQLEQLYGTTSQTKD